MLVLPVDLVRLPAALRPPLHGAVVADARRGCVHERGDALGERRLYEVLALVDLLAEVDAGRGDDRPLHREHRARSGARGAQRGSVVEISDYELRARCRERSGARRVGIAHQGADGRSSFREQRARGGASLAPCCCRDEDRVVMNFHEASLGLF